MAGIAYLYIPETRTYKNHEIEAAQSLSQGLRPLFVHAPW